MQQAHRPPQYEIPPSAPLYKVKDTVHPQEGQQNNQPLAQAHGAMEPVMTSQQQQQQQQPPAESYRREQNLPRLPPPPPAATSPPQQSSRLTVLDLAASPE